MDFSSTLTLGSSLHDLLSSGTFTKLHIEINYISGLKPPKDALLQLKVYPEYTLETVTFETAYAYSFIHEVGYMLGLVDLGSPMIENHAKITLKDIVRIKIESCILF